MNETEYLEQIKLENEAHREQQRKDYQQYLESVKQAMLEIQNNANTGSLRLSLVTSALNGMLAQDRMTFCTDSHKRQLCKHALEIADIMIDMLENEQ